MYLSHSQLRRLRMGSSSFVEVRSAQVEEETIGVDLLVKVLSAGKLGKIKEFLVR